MDEGRRKAERKSISLLVKLKHQNVATFEEEFATNLSEGGMFIRSRTPQPIGTHLKFEVQLAGGQRVMRGTAIVRWVRPPGDPEGGPGMGVQFEQLDDATRAVVDRMIGAKPAGATPAPATAPAAATGELPPEVAALEAELRARYGDPSQAKAAAATSPLPSIGSVAPIAPVVAPIAPVVAPVAPVVAPVAPKPPAAPSKPEPAGDDLFGGVALDEPLSGLPPELDLGLASAPPSSDSIEIPLEALVADTPAPDEEEVPIELETADSSSGAELEIPILDLDAGVPDDGVELELDLSSRGARTTPAWETPPAAAKPATAPAPAPAPAAAAKPAAPVAAKAPPAVAPAKPAAPAAPPPAALPEVRRAAPPQQEAVATPVVLKNEPAPAAPAKQKAGPVFLTAPEKLLETGPVIGIDLGTTNSCVAILQGTRPLVIRSKEGYNTLPSIVTLSNQGKVQIAHRAKSNLIMNPSQTIYGAKRLVGRPFDSAIVRQVREKFHYEVVPDDNGRAAVKLGQNVLSLEEVQGLILKECRELAESHLNQQVGRAVITVPAYYSEPQREAVRRAGWLAGLKVERILNEPTAAALAFGLNKDLDKKILVYDLGGGTFDATLLKIEKNVFEVLATGGDVFLGGIDFDNLIVDLLLSEFQKKEGVRFEGDQVALSRVTEAAEKAKVALSERSTYDVHIPMLMMDPTTMKPRDLKCTLDRKQLEAVALPLIDRTLDAVRDVLLDANLKAKDVDEIILVGGMSRMPLVRDKLKELMGKLPHAGVNADEAVALGAALYCGTVDKVSSVTLIDVLPMTVGVGMPGGGFKRVIERNTPLPAQKSFAVATARDNETTLELSVFQGEDTNVAGNEYLGTVRIEGLPKMPKGVVQVAVTLRLDAECVLHAEALEMKTHKKVSATLATRYTSDEVMKKLGITAEKAAQVEQARAKELESRGGGFWGFLKKVVGRK